MDLFICMVVCFSVYNHTNAGLNSNSTAVAVLQVHNISSQIDIKLGTMGIIANLPWESLLQAAPVSIFLLAQLMVIAGYKTFNLSVDVMQQYKHIRHTNFRPLLVQVTNEGLSAFILAHGNMQQIELEMVGIPQNVRSVLHTLASKHSTPQQIGKYTAIPLNSIRKAADEGARLANDTYMKFFDVQQLLLEVSEILAATQSVKEESLEQNRKDMEIAKLKKSQMEERQKQWKTELDKVSKQVDEAKKSYDKAMDDIPTGWNAAFMDVVKSINVAQIVHMVVSAPSKMLNGLGGGLGQQQQQNDDQTSDDTSDTDQNTEESEDVSKRAYKEGNNKGQTDETSVTKDETEDNRNQQKRNSKKGKPKHKTTKKPKKETEENEDETDEKPKKSEEEKDDNSDSNTDETDELNSENKNENEENSDSDGEETHKRRKKPIRKTTKKPRKQKDKNDDETDDKSGKTENENDENSDGNGDENDETDEKPPKRSHKTTKQPRKEESDDNSDSNNDETDEKPSENEKQNGEKDENEATNAAEKGEKQNEENEENSDNNDEQTDDSEDKTSVKKSKKPAKPTSSTDKQTEPNSFSHSDIWIANSANGIQKGLSKLKSTIEGGDKDEAVKNLQMLVIAFEQQKKQIETNSQSQFYAKVNKLLNEATNLVKKISDAIEIDDQISDNIKSFLTDTDKLIIGGKSVAAIFPDITSDTPTVPTTHSRVAAKIIQPREMSNERWKAQMQQRSLEMLQTRYNKMFDKQMDENKMLNEVMQRMAQLDLSTIEFGQILQNLGEAIKCISRIRESWVKLVQFFQTISSLATVTLGNNVQGLLDYTHGDLSAEDAFYIMTEQRQQIEANAMNTVTVANFLHSVAVAYGSVSNTYILPPLAKITETLSDADKSKQTEQLQQLEKDSLVAQDTIKGICQKQKDKFSGQMKSERGDIDKIFDAVGKPSPDETKQISTGADNLLN